MYDIINHLKEEYFIKWLKFIINKPYVKFNKQSIPSNSDITDTMLNYFNYNVLSTNNLLSINFVLKHLDKSPDNPCGKKWNWQAISRNPNILMEDISNNLHLPWVFQFISHNPNLTMEFIMNNLPIKTTSINNDWNWYLIGKNKNLTIHHIKLLPHVNWLDVSKHPNITMENIENNMDFNWIWKYVSENPNLTISFILKHINLDWDWQKISEHPNMTMEIIQKYKDLNWDYECVSDNPNLTMEMILNNPNKNWISTFALEKSTQQLFNYVPNYKLIHQIITNDKIQIIYKIIKRNKNNGYPPYITFRTQLLNCFSSSPTLTMEIIKKELKKHENDIIKISSWDWNKISENPKITIKDIIDNIRFPWNWNKISMKVKMEDITNNPNLSWCWEYVGLNPNLTIKMLLNNLDKPWHWIHVSKNENIAIRDILNNPKLNWQWYYVTQREDLKINDVMNNLHLNWDYYQIAENDFKYDKNNYIGKNLKKMLLTNILFKQCNRKRFK